MVTTGKSVRGTAPAAGVPAPAPQPDPVVLPVSRPPSLLVRLSARPDAFDAFAAMPRGAERKQAVVDALRGVAATSQKPLLARVDGMIKSGDVSSVRSLFSPNMLVVTPRPDKVDGVLDALRGAQGVAGVYRGNDGSMIYPGQKYSDPAQGPAIVQPPSAGNDHKEHSSQSAGETVSIKGLRPAQKPTGTTWPVKFVGAPAAWRQGADGAGMVFGTIDTGSDLLHPALNASYRGRDASGTYQHDYNWADFVGRSPQPVDYRKHGSHVLGSVVGKDGATITGTAPGARWISAAALDPGAGTVEPYLDALQWMLAPTKMDRSEPRPDRAPDVVGMSWWAGPSHEDLFQDSVRNLVGAGIEVVKSVGNDGPGPETGTSPGQFPEVITVGNVDRRGVIAPDSSRGPSPLRHPEGERPVWKPDLAAPGTDVVSTIPGGNYGYMSGSSMAQPHASGAVLSLLSKYPQLTHDQLVQALAEGARDKGAPGRDLEYGWGVVNIPRALEAAKKILAVPATS